MVNLQVWSGLLECVDYFYLHVRINVIKLYAVNEHLNL